MGERTGRFRRFKHRVVPGRVMNLASNALLAKGVQSFLSPTRIAQALDRGGTTLRSKELPVCVEGPTSHCRSLKRQLAQRVPFTNFRSELCVQSLRLLRRKTTALFLFRARGEPRPVRKKTWAAAPVPASPARRNALRAKKPLRRHSAGAGLVCPDSGVTCLAIFTPDPIANTPVGYWWAMAATAGRPGGPQGPFPLIGVYAGGPSD